MRETEDDFPLHDTEPPPTDPLGHEAPKSFGRMPALGTVFPDDAERIQGLFDEVLTKIERIGAEHSANLTMLNESVRGLGVHISESVARIERSVAAQELRQEHIERRQAEQERRERLFAQNLELLADATWSRQTRPDGWGAIFDTIPSPPP